MAWERPTLDEIKARIWSDLTSRLTGKASLLKTSLLKILGWVFAAAIHLVYGYVEEMLKQLMPDTATGIWLDRHAFIWGIIRKSASFATGNVVFTGIDSTVIPISTLIQTSEGIEYLTTTEGTIADGFAIVSVQAVIAGEAGNLDIPTKLELVNSIEDIDDTIYSGIYRVFHSFPVGTGFAVGDTIVNNTQSGTGLILDTGVIESVPYMDIIIQSGNFDAGDEIDSGTTTANVIGTPANINEVSGGIDTENDEDLRVRILERIRNQPAGGCAHDYERWAKEVEGVANAWAKKASPSAGWVTIIIKASGANPVPSSTLLDTVTAYLEERQCVTADLLVVGIEAVYVDMWLGIIPNTTDIQEAITNNLDLLMSITGEPGVDVKLTRMQNAISTTGVDDYYISDIELNGTPVAIADLDLEGYEYPILNTVTYADF